MLGVVMQRIDRVNELLKREISYILQTELQDPRLELTSISRVETTRDLRQAKVYFSVFGNDEKIESAWEALENAGHLIRKHISKRVRLKFLPQFHFFFDKSLDFRMQVEEKIKEINETD